MAQVGKIITIDYRSFIFKKKLKETEQKKEITKSILKTNPLLQPLIQLMTNPHAQSMFQTQPSKPSTFQYIQPIQQKDEDESEKEIVELEESEDEKAVQEDDENFWRIIGLLAWRNKSDGEAKIHHIQRNLKPNEIKFLKENIGRYANDVVDNLKKYGWLSKANDNEVKNFSYHIVGLGQQMYFSTIKEPEFVQFIWDSNPPEYQKLYDMLESL